MDGDYCPYSQSILEIVVGGIFFTSFYDWAKDTNNLHTWEYISFSQHSFSPWSCVTKTKRLNTSILLLKSFITFSSKITNCCRENCILLYSYYYENSTNPIFLGREWIWSQWLPKPIISKYFGNIQSVNNCFYTPDPPTLFCLDGGKIYMGNIDWYIFQKCKTVPRLYVTKISTYN